MQIFSINSVVCWAKPTRTTANLFWTCFRKRRVSYSARLSAISLNLVIPGCPRLDEVFPRIPGLSLANSANIFSTMGHLQGKQVMQFLEGGLLVVCLAKTKSAFEINKIKKGM
jgi:hypothetical protein